MKRTTRTASLRKKIMYTILSISMVLLCLGGIILTGVVATANSRTQQVLLSHLENIFNFVNKTSISLIFNYDTEGLENIAQAAVDGKEIQYFVFYDAGGKQLTKKSQVIESSALVVFERNLTDEGGKVIGKFKAGVNTAGTQEQVWEMALAMGASIAGVIAILSIAILLVVTRSIRPIGVEAKKLEETSNSLVGTSGSLESLGQNLEGVAGELSASVTESNAAVTEIQSMIMGTISSLHGCNDRLNQATDKAKNGALVIDRLGRSMEDLGTASVELENLVKIIAEIGDRTKVINDIVFKTQLLSFNASIEAARAGEHGRGFAVVAEEVGNLAQLSGQAAHNIRDLIERSRKEVDGMLQLVQGKVTEGKTVASDVVQVFGGISDDMFQISDQLRSVEKASEQQKTSLQQVDIAVTKLSQSVQKNSDVAKEAMTASSTLFNESKGCEEISRTLLHIVEGNGGSTVEKNEDVQSSPIVRIPKKSSQRSLKRVA